MNTETLENAQSKRRSWKKTVFVFFSLLLTVSLISLGALFLYTKDTGLILKGVKVGSLDLSSLNKTDARKTLENQLTPLLDQSLELSIPGQPSEIIKLPLKNLGMSLDWDKIIQLAYDQGRSGNIFQKALSQFNLQKGMSSPLIMEYNWNSDRLQKTLASSLAKFNRPTIDASYKITPENQMIIEKEKPGQEVDLELLTEKIKHINLLQLTPIEVPLKASGQPRVTAAQLEGMKITHLLAKYTTQFDSSLINRTDNIKLAAKTLDGLVLAPREEFSFNQRIGERTAAAGYKEALIIVDNQFTPGLGGGICQVSSTLYNAALLAHLEILERHPHSLEINYVPPGQDATVAYPDLDLKLKNNTLGYLLIRCYIQENSLTFELYGKQE
ncbi:VanW family protein [Desulfitobacterium sp. AusDCA]|uniref:VanW family protein n=1 Tax=Desulfitobacterium sp. AusDCA TaxID=3240383 RepID=UPI003DA7656F